MLRSIGICTALVALLAACGGGDEPVDDASALRGRIARLDQSAAPARHALAIPSATGAPSDAGATGQAGASHGSGGVAPGDAADTPGAQTAEPGGEGCALTDQTPQTAPDGAVADVPQGSQAGLPACDKDSRAGRGI